MKKFIILATLIVSSICFAADRKTVTLTNGEWEPFLSEKYKSHGVASVIVKEAFKLQDIDTKYKFYPWKRAMDNAKMGLQDGSVIWSKNKERERDFLFSKKPILTMDSVVFHLKSSDFKWEGKINIFKKYKLGTTGGYQSGEELDKAIKEGEIEVDIATTDLTNFKKLLVKRIDVFICDKRVGLTLINKYFSKSDQNKITFSKKPFISFAFFLIMNRKKTELIKEFNIGFDKLIKYGRYNEIMDAFSKGEYR